MNEAALATTPLFLCAPIRSRVNYRIVPTPEAEPMRMRALLPLTAMLALSACGDSYKPVDVYMAATPECKDWQEGSRFDLPRGISVATTPPVTLEGGGAVIGDKINLDLELGRRLREHEAGEIVAEGVLLPVDEVVRRRHLERKRRDLRPGMRSRT